MPPSCGFPRPWPLTSLMLEWVVKVSNGCGVWGPRSKLDVFSFSRRLLADITPHINLSHWALPPPALLVQWEVESSLSGGETPEDSPHSFCFTIINSSRLCCPGLGDFNNAPAWSMIRDYENKEITDLCVFPSIVATQQQQLLQQQHSWVIRAELM